MFKRIEPTDRSCRPKRNDIKASAHSTGMARWLRQRMSHPEVVLWASLRGQKLNGLKFRRQHPIGPYVADFCCLEVGLVVEIDGRGHFRHWSRRQHDLKRDDWMAGKGLHILRFSAREMSDVGHVLGVIARFCRRILEERARSGSGTPSVIASPSLRDDTSPLGKGGRKRGTSGVTALGLTRPPHLCDSQLTHAHQHQRHSQSRS
ncbi:MAG: endonuclease domain-containing protein [Phycisphaerales bacterium]